MHKLLLFAMFVIALSRMPKSYLVRQNQWRLILTSRGFITIIAAQFNHGEKEVWLTVFGSVCLIGAYFLSLILARHKATS
jgi:ABC-type spermidine/putrescine transport system permease subunit I